MLELCTTEKRDDTCEKKMKFCGIGKSATKYRVEGVLLY